MSLCNPTSLPQERPLNMWFLWGSNAGPFVWKAGTITATLWYSKLIN